MRQTWSVSVGGFLRHGKLDVDRAALDPQLRQHADCPITITIEPTESRRTNAANRYLWGPIYGAIAEYTGQSKEDIHDEMCVRFTTETVSYTNPKTGEIVELEVVRRTSGMTISRFCRFVDDVKLFSSEFFGLTFEEPGEGYQKERARADAREQRKGAAA